MAMMRLAAEYNPNLNDPQVAQEEDVARSIILCHDMQCQKYIRRAIQHYSTALIYDLKHVYQALPRLLSLWFDFTGIQLNQGTNQKFD
jgi:predicted transposase YbfD/YdcC